MSNPPEGRQPPATPTPSPPVPSGAAAASSILCPRSRLRGDGGGGHTHEAAPQGLGSTGGRAAGPGPVGAAGGRATYCRAAPGGTRLRSGSLAAGGSRLVAIAAAGSGAGRRTAPRRYFPSVALRRGGCGNQLQHVRTVSHHNPPPPQRSGARTCLNWGSPAPARSEGQRLPRGAAGPPARLGSARHGPAHTGSPWGVCGCVRVCECLWGCVGRVDLGDEAQS